METKPQVRLVVVLAVCHNDFHLAEKWLRWAAVLANMAQPYKNRPYEYRLVVWCTKSLEAELVSRLRTAANAFPFFVEIAETPAVYEQGYTPSANYMFRTALEHCERFYPGQAMLWCEADTVPMRFDWVWQIENEYNRGEKPFMGDFHQCEISHMTGNAVYSPNWRKVAPSLARLPQPKPDQGWDSLCAHETVPNMYRSSTIQQIWRPPVIDAAWADKNIKPTTALFHQCKDGSLIDVLTDKAEVDRIPLAPQLKRPTKRSQASVAVKMEIMIVTCRRDLEYLKNCLTSIERFAEGFSGVTLVVPSNERGSFDPLAGRCKVHYFDEMPGKGMLHHQVMKCRADLICPDAEAILHMDADCMFWETATPDDFMAAGKFLMVRERYEDCGRRNPNRMVWRDVVQRAVGFMPEWETMVRHPNVHPRELYPWMRRLVEATTAQPFDRYVLSCQNEFPQGFAEFPTLGAVGIRDYADRYFFVDYDHSRDAAECGVSTKHTQFQYLYRAGRDKIVEFWSHAPFDTYRKDATRFLSGSIPSFHLK